MVILDKHLCPVAVQLLLDMALDFPIYVNGDFPAVPQRNFSRRIEDMGIVLPMRTILMAELINDLRADGHLQPFDGIKSYFTIWVIFPRFSAFLSHEQSLLPPHPLQPTPNREPSSLLEWPRCEGGRQQPRRKAKPS